MEKIRGKKDRKKQKKEEKKYECEEIKDDISFG